MFAIGGMIPSTMVDYPAHIAAVVFTRGCNFRCPYCHNPELLHSPSGCSEPGGVDEAPKAVAQISPEEVLAFLKKRQGFLNGVVVCGGEPTLQPGLADFLREVKSLGYDVKLDTNGSCPEILRTLIEEKLVDFIAMDVKAPLAHYHKLVGRPYDTKPLEESMTLICGSGLPYEFRTTVVKPMHTIDDLKAIGKMIAAKVTAQTGVQDSRFIVQRFKNEGHLLDKSFGSVAHAFGDVEIQSLQVELATEKITCQLRG